MAITRLVNRKVHYGDHPRGSQQLSECFLMMVIKMRLVPDNIMYGLNAYLLRLTPGNDVHLSRRVLAVQLCRYFMPACST
jgi:hypothetical protein